MFELSEQGVQLLSELQFSMMVDELKADPVRSNQLIGLLHEDNVIYDQRGTTAVIRMRGWVLLSFEHLGLPGAGLPFVLEELDNGRDVYIVAAAARALRSYAYPAGEMAPFLMRAINNIQFHDDLVCLERYGGYATLQTGTTAVGELLATLRWLGERARHVVSEIEALLSENAKRGGALSEGQLEELAGTLELIKDAEPSPESSLPDCCVISSGLGNFSEWAFGLRRDARAIESTIFEDQDGDRVAFNDFFRGRPSIVAFFYTRCSNPMKCSLTVTKLARLQKLLIEQGLDNQIRTAAITYDPEFDLAERLRGYGESRGVRMDADNRLLRTVEGMRPLRAYFRLGVNFVASLVNRHKVEVYILDASGSIAASFERIQWNESVVVDRAAALLIQNNMGENTRTSTLVSIQDSTRYSNPSTRSLEIFPPLKPPASHAVAGSAQPTTLSALSIATAFFPKCPICWGTYLSVFGIAGLEQIPYLPWILPVFASLMLINLCSLWLQARLRHSQRRIVGFYLATAGAFAILVLGIGFDLPYASAVGITLTVSGSLLSVFASENRTGLSETWQVKSLAR
jgi:protein SCO1/2